MHILRVDDRCGGLAYPEDPLNLGIPTGGGEGIGEGSLGCRCAARRKCSRNAAARSRACKLP